jgi:CHRD domain
MKTTKLIMYAVFSILITASIAEAASDTFKAKLSGKEVVPPVNTKATGEALFILSKDGKELSFTLKVKNIEDVIMAHIHVGKKGENGAPVAPLFGDAKKEGMFSGELAKGTITDKDLVGVLAGKTLADLVKIIKDGNAYVNVHSDKNRAGEIRGQIKERDKMSNFEDSVN